MTIVRMLAFLAGVPLFVRGVIRLVNGHAAQLSARERSGVQGRRSVDAGATRRAWPLAVGVLFIGWAINPITDRRTFGIIVACAVVYAVAATLWLRWRGGMRGDWRGVFVRSFLAGILYGVAVASAIDLHGVGYAAIFLVPILIAIVMLRVVLRREATL